MDKQLLSEELVTFAGPMLTNDIFRWLPTNCSRLAMLVWTCYHLWVRRSHSRSTRIGLDLGETDPGALP